MSLICLIHVMHSERFLWLHWRWTLNTSLHIQKFVLFTATAIPVLRKKNIPTWAYKDTGVWSKEICTNLKWYQLNCGNNSFTWYIRCFLINYCKFNRLAHCFIEKTTLFVFPRPHSRLASFLRARNVLMSLLVPLRLWVYTQ